jgi:hypothetical protein
LYGELGTYGGLTFEETIRHAIASLQAQAQTGLQMSARWCDKMSAKDASPLQPSPAIEYNYLVALGIIEPMHKQI